MVTPLPQRCFSEALFPESNIPVLDISKHNINPEIELDIDLAITVQMSLSKVLPKHLVNTSANPNATHSWRLFKDYREPTNHQLFIRFGSRTKRQMQHMRELLRSGTLSI